MHTEAVSLVIKPPFELVAVRGLDEALLRSFALHLNVAIGFVYTASSRTRWNVANAALAAGTPQ